MLILNLLSKNLFYQLKSLRIFIQLNLTLRYILNDTISRNFSRLPYDRSQTEWFEQIIIDYKKGPKNPLNIFVTNVSILHFDTVSLKFTFETTTTTRPKNSPLLYDRSIKRNSNYFACAANSSNDTLFQVHSSFSLS